MKPFIATPVGKPFFVKMVTDHYKKGNSGHPLIRRTVDSSLVQYLDIVQNVGDRLSDSDGPPCDPFFHKATNDGFI